MFRSAAATVLLAIVCTASGLEPAHAQTHGRESIVVRSYDTYGVNSGILRTAGAGVVTAFDAAGIDVQWRECRTPRSASSVEPCDQTMLPREVVVRIVGTPRTEHDPNVLGFSYVDAMARRGTLATVYVDRITELAQRLHVESGQMLGHAVAHEVAHLLLGTRTHSSSGMMRDRWLQGHTAAADWMFSAREAEDMRSALATLPLTVALTSLR